ncbi:ras-related protein rab-5c [Anaeramoeba flamelloides]|uniref:Ras-related protein rab-5c n=1 Tax=Anaeramoeba flamelloides TaxID=1746091 RepID=A0AAV7ZZU9_9EUKA|nr:ras-related protein rab-5c [Anaeramoeba flamelloides]KAJ6237383.1 ras-related protein rab-5c [Anaeramoeba flamelloides]
MELPFIQKKMVLLGDSSVGKSSLVFKFVKDQFFENQEPTIGASFLTKTIRFSTHEVKLQIWDTAGQERYESLAPMYYRGASGAFIVYDISSPPTFQKAKFWIKELLANGESGVIIFLVANKSDLEHKVDSVMASKFCEENGLFYIETSAKTGNNVVPVFEEMAKQFEYTPQSKENEEKVIDLDDNADEISGSGRKKCC